MKASVKTLGVYITEKPYPSFDGMRAVVDDCTDVRSIYQYGRQLEVQQSSIPLFPP